MNIRCIVACHNEAGWPVFFSCVVICTKQEYENGDHYELAVQAAKEAGYEGAGFVPFDEVYGPAWLFENVPTGKQVRCRAEGL